MPATIKLGSTGPDVTKWQEALTSAGYAVPTTGTFDQATDQATRAWQASKGLTVDGIVGPASWGAMTGAGGGYQQAGPVATDIAAVPGLAEHTDNAFRYALAKMAARLLTNPDYIAAAMAVETGRTFDPNVRNPLSGAVGLIQFMPKGSAASLTGLGAGGADFLGGLSQVEQLAYVEKYFKPFAGKMQNPNDAYLAVFYPSAMGKPPGYVIASEGSKVYEQNKGFDTAKKGYITAGDVGAAAQHMLSQAAKVARIPITPEDLGPAGGEEVPGSAWAPGATSIVPKIGLVGLLLASGYYLWRWWSKR